MMAMRWLLLGWLLLGWLVCGRLDCAAGGRRCRRGGGRRWQRLRGVVLVVVDGIVVLVDGLLLVPLLPWISSMMP